MLLTHGANLYLRSQPVKGLVRLLLARLFPSTRQRCVLLGPPWVQANRAAPTLHKG
jgi:hypothetical protein